MTCQKCQRNKSPKSFAIRKGTIRHKTCKVCKNKYNKGWYKKNKKSHRAHCNTKRKEQRVLLRYHIREVKKQPCKDCGICYPYYVMQFDHLDGADKEACVGTMVQEACSLEKLQKEISKCEVVCANCHCERTHQRASVV